MPEYVYDLRRVSHITAAAVGQPGQRVFYLQAQKGSDLVSLIAEKEYIRALCLRVDGTLDYLSNDGLTDGTNTLHMRGAVALADRHR